MSIQREPDETPLMAVIAQQDAIFSTLRDDVQVLIGTLFTDEHAGFSRDLRRRQFVRSAYAFFDGTVYALKQVALQRVRETKQILEPGELVLLSEREAQLDGQGRVQERSPRINTLANIRYGLETYVRVHGVPCPVSWGDSQWGDLRAGNGVRDRLMHPKKAEHLIVSDEETLQVMRATLWFTEAVKKVMAAAMVTVVAETPGGSAILNELFPDGLPS